MTEPETSQESELINLEQQFLPHTKVHSGKRLDGELLSGFKDGGARSELFDSYRAKPRPDRDHYCYLSERCDAESDLLGKRPRESDVNQFLALEDDVPQSDPYHGSLISKPPSEEGEERLVSKIQQANLRIPLTGKRQKQSRDYLLNETRVCIPDISFSTVSQACKLLQTNFHTADKRSKQELISVHESFNAIKLTYVLPDCSSLVQGLDVLSPRGFSILKKLAIHDNKSLKGTLRDLLNKNRNGGTAKIQLLTQEIALKLCQEHQGKPLISFITKSLDLFVEDYQLSLKTLTSCADSSKLSELIAYLARMVLKNAPAVKAFLNHFHTLIMRNKTRVATQDLKSSELSILNNALESVMEACLTYQKCFKEDPLMFNKSFWNQCDSFSGGGFVLYIQDQTFMPTMWANWNQPEQYSSDRMSDRQLLTTGSIYASYKEGGTSADISGLQLEEDL
jgi:hypothetical protein